jgi:hypothetical protein
MAPAEWRRPVIIIEAHSAEEHWRAERELLELKPTARGGTGHG